MRWKGPRTPHSSTYFPKRLPKVLREAVVQDRISYTQIGVREHMTEDLYGNSQTCRLVHLKRF
jgi:hypothetical protein